MPMLARVLDWLGAIHNNIAIFSKACKLYVYVLKYVDFSWHISW